MIAINRPSLVATGISKLPAKAKEVISHHSDMKRTWTALLGLLLVAAQAAHAQFTFTTNADNTITITGYTGTGGAVGIPTNITGLPVTSIGTSAFSNKTNLTSVTISNGVTSIGGYAFYRCYGLTGVTIPGSVTNIGEWAFALCESLTNVTIPYGVTSIADYAFFVCDSLTNVTIPNSVTSIGEWAFAVTSLTNVTIPSSVINIGDAAFQQCGNLTSITIPITVTSLGNAAFNYCTGLTSVTVPGSVSSMGTLAFAHCDNLTNVTIANGVSSIAEGTFYASSNLTSVSIPASVTSIAGGAFTECASLAAITVDSQNSFYSSVHGVLFDRNQTTLIEFPYAIGGSYTIPGSVTNIGYAAFNNCAGLTSVTIPRSVTNIVDYAFYSCTNLTSVYFQGNAPTADSTVFAAYYTTNGYDPATIYYLPGTTGWGGFAAKTGLTPVLWNPLIQAGGASFGVRSNQFGFSIAGTANIPIVVEACTNLASPVWTPLQSLTLTNGLFYFSEPVQTNSSGRYYRIGSQ